MIWPLDMTFRKGCNHALFVFAFSFCMRQKKSACIGFSGGRALRVCARFARTRALKWLVTWGECHHAVSWLVPICALHAPQPGRHQHFSWGAQSTDTKARLWPAHNLHLWPVTFTPKLTFNYLWLWSKLSRRSDVQLRGLQHLAAEVAVETWHAVVEVSYIMAVLITLNDRWNSSQVR